MKNNKLLRLIYLIILLTLLFHNPVIAQSPVTPAQIELTLKPEACANETVTVTISEAPIPKLDIAIVIDVTASMNSEINAVTNNTDKIVTNVRAIVPDTMFALGTMADYQGLGGILGLFSGYGGSSDYPWRVDQDFTQEQADIQKALNNIRLMDGGDGPESYLRALYETQFLSWRLGSRRIVILFGDAIPHNPDPGRDAILGTTDDLTQSDVIKQLATANITVLTVYSVQGSRPFYQAVADGTGGKAFGLDKNNSEQIPQIVQQLIEETVSSISILTLKPTSPGDSLVSWQPAVYQNVGSLETRDFAVILCVPPGTDSGLYSFQLSAVGDGAIIGQLPVTIQVPEDKVFPWWLLIPLLLIPLLLLFLWLKNRGSSNRPAVNPPIERKIRKDNSPKPPTNDTERGADVTY